MGYGDQLMATGMARGAAARGKQIAFGDGQQIKWDHFSDTIFKDNPNIARPGSEKSPNLEWIPFFRGSRIYNWHDTVNQKWVWNYSFKAMPGEITFSGAELSFARNFIRPFIVVEPHVPTWKPGSINKQWSIERYTQLVHRLRKDGHQVRQFFNGLLLPGTLPTRTETFRQAMAVIAQASLFIGSEGGLSHAAAALGIPAVVIFGGWVPPSITGYDFHTNLAYGKPCGSLSPCEHCRHILHNLTVDQVYEAVNGRA